MSAAFSPIQASSFVFPSQNKVVASIRNCSSLTGPEQPDAAERPFVWDATACAPASTAAANIPVEGKGRRNIDRPKEDSNAWQ